MQFQINRQREIFAGFRLLVVFSVLITPLNTAFGVAQQNLNTFLTAQLLFVITLDAKFSDEVARLIVVVFLDVGRRNFRYIAEHVGGIGVFIFANRAFLDIKTRKTEHFLLENAEFLVRELSHENLLRIARIAGIFRTVFDVAHPLDEVFLRDADGLAKLHRVESSCHLVHDHHDVVNRLVINHLLAVSVSDDTTRGELDFFQKGIRVGIFLVVVAEQLEHEKADDVNHDYQRGHTTNHITPVFKTMIFHATLLLRKNSIVSSKTLVIRKLPPTFISQ